LLKRREKSSSLAEFSGLLKKRKAHAKLCADTARPAWLKAASWPFLPQRAPQRTQAQTTFDEASGCNGEPYGPSPSLGNLFERDVFLDDHAGNPSWLKPRSS